MHLLPRVFLTAAAVAAVGACGSSESTTRLGMNVSLGAGAVPSVTNGVKANGSNVVTIQIDGATKAPIRVTSSRGLFTNGDRTTNIDATTGTAELVVCDARSDAGCAGPVIVSASDAGSGIGAVTLTFVGYERTCNDERDDNGDGRTDCADPDCDDLACVDNNGNTGTCGSLSCVLPICTPTGSTEVCDNRTDDDCSGQIDCQQSSCDNQPCKTGRPRSSARRGSAPTSAPASVSPSCRRGRGCRPTAWRRRPSR